MRIDARAGMVDMSFVTVLVRIPIAYRARPISESAATGAELKAYKKLTMSENRCKYEMKELLVRTAVPPPHLLLLPEHLDPSST